MPKHYLEMFLAPIINEENKLLGYEITYDETEAVFSVTYSAESWTEKDENDVYHEYTDFDVKQMEILGFTDVFQFVRVATSLERYLNPFIRAHYYTAYITGHLND